MATNKSNSQPVPKDLPKRDSKARTASAAVFFNENKSIAGFGNSMRAVFTSVRELVENSLDASEKRGVTPEIKVNLRKLERSELVELMGTNVIKTKDKRVEFIELSCRDNGVGVPRELIPQLFGTVLAGTKYGAQQTRGRFGLGSKMVLLYAMSTLDLPIQITTRPEGEDVTYRVELFINLEKNKPIIHSDERFEEGDPEYFNDYGTEIKVSFTGSWSLAKLYVREYFRQLAIITPYADMVVDLPGDDDDVDHLVFQRVVDEIPKPPEVVRVHPWGTDISTFRREMTHATEDNLIDFLVDNFMGVNKKAAIGFFEEVGVETDKRPQDLTSQEIRRIVHDGFARALKEERAQLPRSERIFKFKPPSGDSLSPLGSDRLRKGLEKELDPEFVQSITRDPSAYEGHPFIIEAAIGYGGGVNSAAQSKGVTIVDNRVIYRYANRIPLIFGAGSDLITNVANSINWSDYGLTRGTEPLAIAVSLVSTKIPFPETSKEYIDKVEEIGAEIRLTLMALGRNLKRFLGRRRRRQRERKRKSRFERYAPRTVSNLLRILQKEQLWNPNTGVPRERIVAALASGKPRIGSAKLPLRESIFQAPIWSLPETRQQLQENGIFEVATFLRSSNKKLSSIVDLNQDEVDLIKRRTIAELDKADQIPELDTEIIMPSDDEIRFHRRDEKEKLIDLPRLYKACNRRWIRNAYDYLVSTDRQLHKVQGLSIKLVEKERVHVIRSLFDEVDEVDLADELSGLLDNGGLLGDPGAELDKFTQEELPDDIVVDESQPIDVQELKDKDGNLIIVIQSLFPPLEDIYEHEKLNKRKVNSVLELLLETTHPSSPIDEKVLAPVLIPAFQENLEGLVKSNPEYGKIKVDVSSQDWIDGYLRNAFKRRDISTVNDVIAADIDLLLEIGELQRTLFYGLRDSLIPEKSSIRVHEFNTTHAKEKIKLLEDAGIDSLEKFAAMESAEIAQNEDLIPYVNLIIDESKDIIVDHLNFNNLLGPLNLLKQISPEIEEEMDRLEITDSMELLTIPLEEITEEYRDRVRLAKQEIGMNFEGFYKKHQSAMEDLDIVVLEELVFNPNHHLQREMSQTTRDELVELLEYITEPPVLLSPALIPSMDILHDAGVNSVGKFLVWPQDKLATIIDMPEEWVNLLCNSFQVQDLKSARKDYLPPIKRVGNILQSYELEKLQEVGLSSVTECTSIKWGIEQPLIEGKWEKLESLNAILLSPVHTIVEDITSNEKNLKKGFEYLEESEIDSFLQFIRLPMKSVLDAMNTTAKRAPEAIEQLLIDLKSEEPSMIKADSDFYRAAVIFHAIEKLKAPIVALSEFSTREINLLSEEGIKSIHQLLVLPDDEIGEIIDLSASEVADKIKSSSFKAKGTPLSIKDGNSMRSIIQFDREGDTYFKSEEIAALSASGYDTVESLYYMSDHRTFDVAVLDGTGSAVIGWETIRHFKKLLESPPVLITWKKVIEEERLISSQAESDQEVSLFSSPPEEAKEKDEEEPEYETIEIEHYEVFSSQELEILTNHNIRRVIDFLTAPTEQITELLDWDLEKAADRQTSIILQEAGIELSDLEIFRDDHIDHLKELGLITIEDLYFTAKEETWESTKLPWRPIQTLKNILHLPLIHVVQEIGEDILDLLLDNKVSNILEFILTGDPILEQKTGLPAERFENLKYSLDFGSLIEAFDKTILFTPNLTFDECKKLHGEGYDKILDLVLADKKTIADLLDYSIEEVEMLLDQISRNDIRRAENERGVKLKEINAFSRSDIRAIIQSGIFQMNQMDTIQEVLYQITPASFQGDPYLLEMVVNLQKVCKLDLLKIGDLNEDDVQILKDNGVNSIADTILIRYEELGDVSSQFDDALNAVTKSVMDMQPFIAMGQLPVQSAMVEGENEENLLDVWLEGSANLHQRTMRNIRSILSLPVRLTSLSKLTEQVDEELGSTTIADIVLEYVPSEDDPHYPIQQALKTTGSLVKLLREGSTPLTLVDLEASEFRSLIEAGINTIERVMMNDVRTLSKISGTTQKYWREMKELFDPEVFNARLGDIGIPVSAISLDDEDNEYLEQFGISYLDQISVYDSPNGIIRDLQDFLFAPMYFMAGNPGEREMAENHGARSILEAVVALKKEGASPDLINEVVNLAWQSYSKYLFETPSRSSKNDVETIQDLCKVYTYNPDVLTRRQTEYAELYLNSPMLLPLTSIELENIVIENRCVTIIDALSNPMVGGSIDDVRDSIQNDEDPEILTEISLPNILLKDISKTIWKRIEKSDLSLQQVISSPRTLEVYKSTKQKYLQEARQALRIPLSRIHIDGDQPLMKIGKYDDYLRLDDLIFDLPTLYSKDSNIVQTISSVLGSEDIEVLSDLSLSDDLIKAAETTFGQAVEGFHDLWVTTWRGLDILTKIDTEPSETITSYITRASSPVSNISGIKPVEIWQLWKLGIITIADVLLVPRDDLGTTDYFTKKRVSQLKTAALESLENEFTESNLTIPIVGTYFDEDISSGATYHVSLLHHEHPHPLIRQELDDVNTSFTNKLEYPVMNTKFGEDLEPDVIDLFHEQGIFTVLDFLLYPEEMKQLPKRFMKQEDRLQLLVGSYELVSDLSVDDLKLPEILTETMNSSDSVAKLLYNLSQASDKKLVKAISIPLKYADLDEDVYETLTSAEVSSTYDLLHLTPVKIAELLGTEEKKVKSILGDINFTGLFERLENAPLQVNDIESISKGGRNLLREQDIYTALDLKLPLPNGLNRIDTSYLTTLTQVLDTELSYLLVLDDFNRDEITKLADTYSTIRELYREYSELTSSQQKVLGKLTSDNLVDLEEKHRDLHDIEDIIIKDEKQLLKAGIFTFETLASTSSDELVEAGLDEEKAPLIPELLNSHWRNIVNLPKDAEDIAEDLNLKTVAEVLHAPEVMSIEIATPIKIRHELKLAQLFSEVPTQVSEAGVSSISDFIRSEPLMKAFAEGEKDVIKLVSQLHAWIGHLPGIEQRWIPRLEKSGIFRIWQFILEDASALSDICGTSIKAQEKFKEDLSLDDLEPEREFHIPTLYKKDAKLFADYGFYSLKEILQDGLISDYISRIDELEEKIELYQQALQYPIYKLESYWQLDVDTRRLMAKQAETLTELARENIEAAEELIADAIKENFREMHPLDRWIADKSELKRLQEKDIKSVEDWMFYNTRGVIEPGTPSFVLFRSTLDIIPYFTIKHIVSGYHNGMTHISDMLLENNKDLAKKLRTTSNKVEELLESVPSIDDKRPELPDLGLVNTSIVESMREGGIYSWAQVLGNAVQEEIESIKGVTWNTVESVREYADVPMWHSLEIRALGIDHLRKLVDEGVSTIADILVLGQKFNEFLGDEKQYHDILANISRANLKKGAESISIRMSESYKIRVKDIPEYEKAGILSPIDVLIGNYEVPKDSDLKDGVEDWIRLGDLDVEEINFPMKVIKKLRKMGIKKVQDAILAPDSQLRDAGATNHQIRAFRKDLNRLKKGEKRIS